MVRVGSAITVSDGQVDGGCAAAGHGVVVLVVRAVGRVPGEGSAGALRGAALDLAHSCPMHLHLYMV